MIIQLLLLRPITQYALYAYVFCFFVFHIFGYFLDAKKNRNLFLWVYNSFCSLPHEKNVALWNEKSKQSRAPWSCGLICHVLDREVGDSNLGLALFFWTRRLKKQKTKNEASHLEKPWKPKKTMFGEKGRRDSNYQLQVFVWRHLSNINCNV